MRCRILAALLALASIGVAASCSSPESLGRGFDIDAGAPGASFADMDASDSDSDAEVGLTSYCPSNRCPEGRTTCPTSSFPCDVDLLSDRENCGRCGNACQALGGGSTECVEGHCILACPAPPRNIDCDGLPDNGCETKSVTNENCGGCGVKCTDPAKPCIDTGNGVRCGCKAGLIMCPHPVSGEPSCLDPSADDMNCGACGRVCDPAGDGAPTPPTNTRYGCIGGECGKVKCESGFMDCDGNPSNGCETSTLSSDNCGGCGNACAPGLECRGNKVMKPTCSCPGGETYCPYFSIELGETTVYLAGTCTNLGSDRDNCGACFHACVGGGNTSIAACTYGMCTKQCVHGRADCNGDPFDECEIDIDSDPRNCGGCGRVCDAIAGQACVGGRCVVEPCDDVQDGGELAR